MAPNTFRGYIWLGVLQLINLCYNVKSTFHDLSLGRLGEHPDWQPSHYGYIKLILFNIASFLIIRIDSRHILPLDIGMHKVDFLLLLNSISLFCNKMMLVPK